MMGNILTDIGITLAVLAVLGCIAVGVAIWRGSKPADLWAWVRSLFGVSKE